MSDNATRPNLFHYATSELSQDAVISWMLAWADRDFGALDPHLHKLALSLIRSCFEKHGRSAPEQIESITVHRQYGKIDVLADINEEFLLLIEDKVHSKEHSNQLNKYLDFLKNDATYADRLVLPIYLQTGEQSSHDAVQEATYPVLNRGDLIELLKEAVVQGCTNAILVDFHAHLERIEDEVKSFLTTSPTKDPWGGWTGLAWQGFFRRLQAEGVQGGWSYVANPSGGFMAFWWGGATESPVYLQLENERLCFKVSVAPEEDKRGIRRSWSERIIRAGQQRGLNVARPGRFGSGNTMTVASIKEYRMVNPDGILDMEGTLGVLREAETLLREI